MCIRILWIATKWCNTMHNYDRNNVRIVVNAQVLRMARGEICKFYAAFYASPSPVIIGLFVESWTMLKACLLRNYSRAANLYYCYICFFFCIYIVTLYIHLIVYIIYIYIITKIYNISYFLYKCYKKELKHIFIF